MTHNFLNQEVLDASLLSWAVYDDQNAPVTLPGWERLYDSNEILGSTNTGYYGVLFKNTSSNELFVAHAGTNDSVDVNSYDNFITGGLPNQFDDAHQFSIDAILRYNNENPQSTIQLNQVIHTGHSLGAADSNLVGIVTGAKSYGFNGPGVGGFFLELAQVIEGQTFESLINTDFSNQIINIGLSTDPVSTIPFSQVGSFNTVEYNFSSNSNALPYIASLTDPFAVGLSHLSNDMKYALQAHSIKMLHMYMDNEVNGTQISDLTLQSFIESFENETGISEVEAYLALTEVLKASVRLGNSNHLIMNGYDLDNLVASYTDPQGNTLTTQQFLNLTENQTFANSSISYQYSDYNNGAGQIIIVEKIGGKVFFPADNDADYSITFNYNDNSSFEDNPSYVDPDSISKLLNVDITGSQQTAGVALENVPLKPEYVPEKVVVKDGASETNYDAYQLDAEDLNQELGGGYYADDVKVVTNSGGLSVSYVKEGTQTNIDGSDYLLTNVIDGFVEAGEAVAGFIDSQAQDAVAWFSAENGAQVAFGEWLGANMEDLIDGNLDADEAFIDLAQFLGQRFIGHQITQSMTGSEALTLMTDVFIDQGVDFGTAVELADGMNDVISRMAVEFTFNSQGWDSTQYTNAGLTIVSAVITQKIVEQQFGLKGAEAGAAVAAVTTVVSTLLNDHELNSSEFIMLGVQAGVAAGIGLAAPAIAGAFLTAGTLALSVAIPVVGALLGLAAGKIISSIYSGKKFYEGEYGDKGVLISTLRQIQDIEIEDINGNITTVQALVATNSSGSTLQLQDYEGVTYGIGSTGADIIVGTETADVMSGGGGNDYIEGKDGDEEISGGDGNDHLIGAEGDDQIQGDAGDDIIFGDAGEDLLIGGDGQDFIHAGSGDDTISGGLERDTILASGGNDVVQGAEGDDVIDGGYGDDLLDGGEGDDLLLGNLGNDSISGGDGDDKAFGDEGNDQIAGGAGDDYLNGGYGVDILEGGNGSDLLYGDQGDDYLQGDLGNDDLGGGAGDDTLLGGLDDDYLWGQDGDDELDGGSGDDFLIGGFGSDALNGGEGSDVYVLEADDSGLFGDDEIIDTEGANDRIYINGLDGTNESNLGLVKDGDNLLVSYNAVTIATVAGHFLSSADSIERIEFDGDQWIDLSTVTYDGTTGVGAFAAATDSSQTTMADIELREDNIDANLQLQSQFWNNGFIQNLSELAYEEALRDQFETEYYNGSDITEFKRSRGKFGGHYKVYKLEQGDQLDPSNPDIVSYTLLNTGYDPSSYDEVVDGEISNQECCGVGCYSNDEHTIKYSIEDYFIDGEVVNTKVHQLRLNNFNDFQFWLLHT